MKPFTIAFVGRPNVGKSSLFNALLGYRRTIVLDLPGTTMDEVREKVAWEGHRFHLMDSQGIFDEGDVRVMGSLLSKADACLFVVDATTGVTPFDRWIASVLHKAKKPVLVCVNKADAAPATLYDFAALGFESMVETSASHRRNVQAVKDWALKIAGLEPKNGEGGQKPQEEKEPLTLTLALIGRPNTGKSTLMNRLCRENVSRVSPQPLTTRDPVTFEVQAPQGTVKIIDTAGMRRPRAQKEPVEIFSVQASARAIRQADVVFLLIASHEAITDQDMRLLSLIEKEGKPAVVLLNFWDQLSTNAKKHFLQESEFAKYLSQFESLPISGRTGFNVDKSLSLAFRLWKQAKYRVSTSQLNRIVERMVQRNPPPTLGKRYFNILYASQVKTEPPTFVFFMNRKGALPESYRRYLENCLRQELRFKSQPVRLFFRGEKE